MGMKRKNAKGWAHLPPELLQRRDGSVVERLFYLVAHVLLAELELPLARVTTPPFSNSWLCAGRATPTSVPTALPPSTLDTLHPSSYDACPLATPFPIVSVLFFYEITISEMLFMNEFDYQAVQVEPPYQEGMGRIRALSGAQVYDTLSQVCNRWAIAINNSPFWQTLTQYVYGSDPRMWDSLVHMWFTNGIERVMTRDHFVHARATVCGVCVAYSPRVHFALSGASTWTVAGGRVSLCKYHDQNGFCGMCFKDENVLRSAADNNNSLSFSANPENNQQYSTLSAVHETDTYFGRLRHTCERCRVMATRSLLRHHKLNSHLIRSTDMDELFHTYQVLGEGSLFNLVFQVHERRWLLTNTKIKDFSFQAIASDRVIRGMPMAEAMMMNSSDPEDSYILYNEPSVRELALRDFMRSCVLGGCWFAPTDVANLSSQQAQYQATSSYWHNGQPTNFDVVHPTRGERRSITWYYPVPTQEIKASLQSLWFQTMIEILETAFKNIIAEVLDGCLVDSKVWEFENGGETAPGSISDPGPQLQSWSMQHVWERLLRSEYWVTGYNWRSRKLDEHRARRISDASSSFSLSKSSSTSVDSVTQSSESPTGTTSTMQTSPSPPPPHHNGQSKDVKSPEPMSMSTDVDVHKATVSPVLQIPDLPDIELTGAQARLVQSVPFVPATWMILPQESVRCISQLWIKTIHPFVACQCGICKRACQLQEEERLRGSPKKRPTAGIVINEPRHHHHHDSDDIFDDEDYDEDLDSNDEDFEANIMAMDSDPMDEEVGIVDALHPAEQTTPVQLIQQPATPPETLTPELSPTTGRAQPRLAKIEQPPVGSLSPPTWRKRASQELESAPPSPSSAVKRRRLDSESSNKVDSPSVYSDSREPQSQSESTTTFSPSEDADPNSLPESSPPESVNSPAPRVQTPNPPSSNNKEGGAGTPLHPAGFEEVTGIPAPNESVGISLLDFSLDEDLTETGLLAEKQADSEQAPQNNTAMQWEQQ
ncbi:hypothetical protein CPB86DRAFT_828060 [Serendipita vermifera]|nr:hypothetical protein CPB86DRAFT_828060 [Serendipita vermifera]